MLKTNKKFFIVTCIITVLPILVGLLLWDQLPDRVATHFGTDGTPNGYSSRLFAVIGIYLFCLAAHVLINALMAVILIVIGNYLPKCRQNYTIGIKLPWTLADEDNWNYTHRMAGKWWILGGVLSFMAAFQPWIDPVYVSLAIIMIVTLIPGVASYLYFRKHSL